MKTKIIIAILLFTLNTVLCIGQERVSLSILQDVKLATIGDKERNYDAFTLDMLVRLKMQGNQQKYGYLTIYPEFEYADLKQSYIRYSANVGYTFNKLIVNNFDVALIGGIGMINREGESSSSLSLTGEIGYSLNDWLKLVIDAQLVQRSDIEKYVTSGFLGIEIKIF